MTVAAEEEMDIALCGQPGYGSRQFEKRVAVKVGKVLYPEGF